MDTKGIFNTLKGRATNIRALTIVKNESHVSLTKGSHDIATALDIFSNGQLEDVEAVVVSWNKKADAERSELQDLDGVKIISFEQKGKNPQDIITFA